MRENAGGLQLLLNERISLKQGPKFVHGISKTKCFHGNRDFMKCWILQQSNRFL